MTAYPMPKPGLPADAQEALRLLDRYVHATYPGARIDLPVFRATDGVIDGFALYHEGGLSVVFVDATGVENGGQWMLQMSAVLAVDIPDVAGALIWANERNQRSLVDRYYCAISRDGDTCAVLADTSVSSVLLSSFASPPNQAVIHMLRSLTRNTLHSAAIEPESLLNRCRGRRLTTSDQDLMALFVISGA